MNWGVEKNKHIKWKQMRSQRFFSSTILEYISFYPNKIPLRQTDRQFLGSNNCWYKKKYRTKCKYLEEFFFLCQFSSKLATLNPKVLGEFLSFGKWRFVTQFVVQKYLSKNFLCKRCRKNLSQQLQHNYRA